MSINKVGLNCVGCKACAQVCKQNLIEFVENEEGFSYPVVSAEVVCKECGFCEKVCPALIQPKNKEQIVIYASWIKDKKTLSESSSGGLFTSLARYIIQNNGIVFGCVLDENLVPYHAYAEDVDGLALIRGSKYVESEIAKTYTVVKNFLEKGRFVLFTGSPCQVAGLKNVLGENYENLYTADIICHGVPSRKMFSKYILFLEKKHHSKISDYKFRDKKKHNWSLSYSYNTINRSGKNKRYEGISSMSPYIYGSLSGIFHRESCYRCNYATRERVGDITLGDFWGVEKQSPANMNVDGVSVVLVNSDKGNIMIEKMKKELHKDIITFDMASWKNQQLLKPTHRPQKRDIIYKELNEKGFSYIAERYLKAPRLYLECIKNRIPNLWRQRIKRIIHF